ncbi:hypothetical protein [Actinoplanes couchii]|nr:hypothetical protein [Actinoplanes couchii]MDR6320490.1 hypothetical protein [Actinoplanes couchii]
MKTLTGIMTAATVAALVTLVPTSASAAPQRCVAAAPTPDFYAAGRISTTPVTDTNSRCTTISISDVRDTADPSDTCQTFLVAVGSLYSDPVEACAGTRTVLATGIPAGARFRVLYQVDYIDPAPQVVAFKVWY